MSGLRSSDLASGLMLGAGVELGDGVRIGAHVVIHDGVLVGDGCTIQDGAVLGKEPRLGTRSTAEQTGHEETVIEPGASVCSHAVVNRGARIGPRSVIGDHVLVRERAQIGPDTVIGHGGAIGVGVRIGCRVRLQNSVIVAPGSVLEDDVFLGPRVCITNDATMGRHDRSVELRGITARRACRIGAAATLMPGVEIGEEAIVGAASLVTHDVPARTVVLGVPARQTRRVSDQELLERWSG